MRKVIISLFALVFIYSFTPQDVPNTFTDSRDGKVYKTVTIGSQVWMAENLAYLPYVVGPGTGSATEPYYYVYGYNGADVVAAKATINYGTYGVLYNWNAAMFACPPGWHLPSDAEWTQLENYLANNGYNYDGSTGGGRTKIAKSLASASGWISYSGTGTVGNTDYPAYRNKSGFSALPGGYRYYGGTFSSIGSNDDWWSSTESSTNSAWLRYLYYNDSGVSRTRDAKESGFSVRCVRDNDLLTVTTSQVADITTTTATCSGTVTSEGGSSVTARGVCWSTSQNPTTSNFRTTNGTGSGTYTSNITGLSPNTTYYVRAYARTAQETAYGEQKSFRTTPRSNPSPSQGMVGNAFTDPRDGKVYKTVKIGNQTWMAENLAYLPNVVGPGTGSEDTDHETDPYYYVYDYYGTNVAEAKATADYQTYGVLYSWYAAKTACPKGWHLPSDNEWGQLETYLANNNHNYDGSPSGDDDRAKIAKSMASATGWNYADKEGAPGNTDYPEYINKSGFSALPGGSRSLSGSFYGGGGFSYWWSSLVSGSNSTLYRSLSYNQSKINRSFNSLRDNGFSVRCVKSVTLPKVTIGQLTNISTTTATFSANVASDDESSITARGVCWSTSPYPTTSDFKTINGTGSGTYTSNIAGLSPNTTYYVRAYARNAQGTVYGELMISFRTAPSPSQGMVGNAFTDSRDDKMYKTVTIGSQVWMAENLAYLPYVVGPGTGSPFSAYYYVYGYDGTNVAEAKATANYKTYGVLYNWPAAMNKAESSDANPSGVQGACPPGWHLPSDDEWKQLEIYLGMSHEEADKDIHRKDTEVVVKLKEAGTFHWDSPNNGATNSSGFTALPGGWRDSDDFNDIGACGAWWSSTEGSFDTNCAWTRFLWYNGRTLERLPIRFGNEYKDNGLSVRCVWDNNLPVVATGKVTDITATTATFSANVASDGGSSVTARGVCWSTLQSPTTSNSRTTNGTGLGTNTNKITGLSPNTTYYVRAYATNAQGTAYGEQKSFKTSTSPSPTPTRGMAGNTFTDPRDGKMYKTVTIGSQVWMAENLAYLPRVVGLRTGSQFFAYYYVYGYDGTNVAEAKATANYKTYGVLYNWPAAMDEAESSDANPSGVQGACPSGWHLPSDAEWTQLENYLADNGHNYDGTTGGVRNKIAKSLASASGWNSYSETGSVGNTDYPAYRNKSGFSALPGGYRQSNGYFNSIGNDGGWWSSTESEFNTNTAWDRFVSYYPSHLIIPGDKESGFSVRCVRDNNLPAVTTSQVADITTTTATCSGNVTSDGGLSVTARGICWSTSPNPTTSNSKTINGTALGNYTSNITGLSPNTTYYVRAYAINAQGTVYGKQKSFRTTPRSNPSSSQEMVGNAFTDSRDGKVYKIVTIGSQVWMAENLAYLPSVVSPRTGSQIIAYNYVYGYDGTNVAEAKATANYKTYGVLYNWPAAMNGAASSDANPSGVQGICPPGWHLPSDDEWIQLERYLINNGHKYDGSIGSPQYIGENIAKSMTSAIGWDDADEEGAPGNTDYPEYINKSGFSALPGGHRSYFSGDFYYIGSIGYWWSSKENVDDSVFYWSLECHNCNFWPGAGSPKYGFSVRCVWDNNLPVVTTSQVADITTTTATCSGNVTSVGGSSVTARGVCWNTSQNPTTSNFRTTNGTGSGNYTSNITGLSSNTTYYVRAYATNAQGTAYGEQKAFRTSPSPGMVGNTFTDSRDGKVYKIVTIGSQVWMAENLAYLPSVCPPNSESPSLPYYYVYDYNGTNVTVAKATANNTTYGVVNYTTYGVLYNWPAAMTACPEGWHLPNDVEWKQMEMYLGMTRDDADQTGRRGTYEGGKLKEAGTGHWPYPNTEATNESGFTALPGGSRAKDGTFGHIGYKGYWWSSTECVDDRAWGRILYYSCSEVLSYDDFYKEDGLSVRCLRD